MRLSLALVFVLLTIVSGTTSCSFTAKEEVMPKYLEALQQKEWTLTRRVTDGESFDVPLQRFNFISDTQVEYTQLSNSGSVITRTYDYEIDYSVTYGVQFDVVVPNTFLYLPVIGITDDIMTVAINDRSFLEYQ